MAIHKILVVDDDFMILDALGLMLNSEGYIVDLLPYGEKIFENIADFDPDLIILDVMLGTTNGMVLYNVIKDTATLEHIPILMMTASETVVKILKERFSPEDYVQKPFDTDSLIGKIRLKLGTESAKEKA